MSETIETAEIVAISPTKVWIESDFMGDKYVMIQHEGVEPFEWCRFGYHHAYTCNATQWREAESMARRLGATGEIERRNRPIKPPST